jgi:hypothetical protein
MKAYYSGPSDEMRRTLYRTRHSLARSCNLSKPVHGLAICVCHPFGNVIEELHTSTLKTGRWRICVIMKSSLHQRKQLE